MYLLADEVTQIQGIAGVLCYPPEKPRQGGGGGALARSNCAVLVGLPSNGMHTDDATALIGIIVALDQTDIFKPFIPRKCKNNVKALEVGAVVHGGDINVDELAEDSAVDIGNEEAEGGMGGQGLEPKVRDVHDQLSATVVQGFSNEGVLFLGRADGEFRVAVDIVQFVLQLQQGSDDIWFWGWRHGSG